MKKILALVLALCMVFALCACGQSAATTTTTTDAAATTASTADDTAADDAATPVTTVKAGLICLHDENSGYDNNFITAFKAACESLGVEYEIKTNIPETSEAEEAALELADNGCNVIFSDSYGHQDFVLNAAMECPEVQFTSCTGDKALTAGVENYHNAFATIFEARYLAGVAAGMKLQEMIDNGVVDADNAKIGYVGAMTYAEVKSGYTSWFLGVKSVVPTVTMDVTFTGSWYDETLENEGANTLIEGGAVILSQHADSMGAPNACQSAGVVNVSYNGSTKEACPDTYLISSRINWQPYFEYAIGAVMAGENYDTDWTGTIATGSVLLTELNEDIAAPGTAEKLAEVQAALEDGSLKVFDTANFTVGGEHLTSYTNSWGMDGAECIVDGVFTESTLRSAPYFDIDIDGITLLGQ